MTDFQIEAQMVRALAEIDAALGLPDDGCNSTQKTLLAIKLLHEAHKDDVAEIERLRTTAVKLHTAVERGCYFLMEMMKAYERRIRSDCKTQEEIDKRPWECAEYVAAAAYLRAVRPVEKERL